MRKFVRKLLWILTFFHEKGTHVSLNDQFQFGVFPDLYVLSCLDLKGKNLLP